jgi:hypothetical protein
MHSLQVARAWTRLYGPPSWRELACIFLHDVGHVGLDYLDHYEQKKAHWHLGARLARLLFGEPGWRLAAGHCSHSGEPRSRLYYADKLSWHLAPRWWLWLNTVFEPKLMVGFRSRMAAVDDFKAQVAESVGNGEFRSTHRMYLERQARANNKKENI